MSLLLLLGIIFTVLGFGGIVVFFSKKIPILLKLSAIVPPNIEKEGLAESLKSKIKGFKYSLSLPEVLAWAEKNLRKLRIFILKIDNIAFNLIKYARDKADVWTIRSRAWGEHHKLKEKEKTQLLENLDKLEVSETLQKISEEAAKEEDIALKNKIENLTNIHNGKEAEILESKGENEEKDSFIGEKGNLDFPKKLEELNVDEEERKYIDLIAQNPKNSEAYRALASIYLSKDNFSDARACLRQVLKINPDDITAKQKLEEIKGLRSKKEKRSE